RHPAVVAGTLALAFTAILAIGVGYFLVSREQGKTLEERGKTLEEQQARLEQEKQAQEARQARALSQVDALLGAAPQAVPALLDGLEPFREQIRPRLHEVADEAPPKEQTRDPFTRHLHRRTRAALALLVEEPQRLDFLRKRLL